MKVIGLDLHKESFNLNEKIENVIKDISNKTHNYKEPNNPIEISLQPQQDPISVFADKIRIFEVLSNLLNNAIKFSNDKPITISARTVKKNNKHFHSSDKENGDVQDITDAEIVIVSVIDRGNGIDGKFCLAYLQNLQQSQIKAPD